LEELYLRSRAWRHRYAVTRPRQPRRRFATATQPLLEWSWLAADDDLPPPLILKMPTRKLPKPDF